MKTARRFLAFALVFLMLFGELGSPIAMAANAGADRTVTEPQAPAPEAEKTENESAANGDVSIQSSVQQSSDEPSTTAPAEDAPAAPVEEPVETAPAAPADEPAADEPAADEPAADEPAAGEPVAEESAPMSLNEENGIMPIASNWSVDMHLEKITEGTEFEVGDKITYKLTAKNTRRYFQIDHLYFTISGGTGEIETSDVDLPEDSSYTTKTNGWHVEKIPKDGTVTIEFTYTVTEADVAKGETLTIKADSETGRGEIASESKNVNITLKKTVLSVVIKPKQETVTYNGEEHKVSGFDYEVIGAPKTVSDPKSLVEVNWKTASKSVSGIEAESYTEAVSQDDFSVSVKNGKVYKLAENGVSVNGDLSLTIDPATLTITAESQTKEYDGKPLVAPDAKIDGLVGEDAEKVKVTTTGSVTNVGKSVAIGYTIEWNGVNQDNYDVKEELGTLTVTAKNVQGEDGSLKGITVSEPEDVTYNGTEQKQPLEIKDGEKTLVQSVDYDLSYSNAVNAGTVKVTVTFKGNYSGEASTSYEITPATLTITAESQTKEYDGKPLVAPDAKIDGLVGEDAEKVKVTTTGSVTNVGESVAIGYAIEWNGVNQDNYDVKEELGTLTVTAKNVQGEDGSLAGITVSTPGDVTYNGQTQEQKPEVKDGQTVLTEGTDYDLSYGDAVNAGTVEVKVTFKGNYSGEASTTYEIKKAEVTIKPKDASKSFDGQPLTASEYEYVGEGTFFGSDADNYDFAYTGEQTDPGESESGVTATLNAGVPDNYTIQTQPGKLTVGVPALPTFEELKDRLFFYVSCVAVDNTRAHEGRRDNFDKHYPADAEYVTIGDVYSVEQDGETRYRVNLTVNWEILCEKYSDDVDQRHVLNQMENEPIVLQYFTKEQSEAESAYEAGWNWLQTGGTKYDVAPSGKDLHIGTTANCKYMAVYEDGCGQAFDTQLYYPFLDAPIPEFNSGDKKADVNDSGDPVREGYAFTGWSTSGDTESGITYSATWKEDFNGDGKADEDQILTFTVTGKKDSRTYNGEDQTLDGYDYKVFIDDTEYTAEEAAAFGVTLTYFGDASITRRDVSPAPYTQPLDALNFIFFPNDENNNYLPFKWTQGEGVTVESDIELTITPAPVTIKPVDASKAYDGTALTASGYEFVGDGRFYGRDAENYTFTYGGSQTEAGEGESTVTAKLKDGKPANYAIQTQPGKLTVTEANAKDAFVVDTPENSMYDGTEHKWVPSVTDSRTNKPLVEGTDYTVSYSPDDFVNAGTITVTITGQGNYTGTITRTYKIAKRPIFLLAVDTFTYDGQEHKATARVENTVDWVSLDSWKQPNNGVTYYPLVEGDKIGEIVKELSNSATNWTPGYGKSGFPVTDWVKLVNKNGEDVSANYTGYLQVQITINKRPVTLTSQTLTKAYDGTPLTNGDAAVIVGDPGFVDGEGVESYSFSGSQTLPGSSKNDFSYKAQEGTDLNNYKITKQIGDLTVTDRPADGKFQITMQPNGGTFAYNGEEQSVSGFEALNFEVNGVSYTVEGLSASASGTEPGRYPVAVTGEAVVRDAGGNDVTKQFEVIRGTAELVIDPMITVTVENGTADPDDEQIRVAYEGDQTITFTADEGNALESVTVDGAAAALAADGSYTFEDVAGNHSIVVVFSADSDGDGTPDATETNDITVTVTGGTAAPAVNPITVAYGANQTITFTANAGNALESVTVDGAAAALAADGSYTFEDVADNHSIAVVFSADSDGDGVADVNETNDITVTVTNGTAAPAGSPITVAFGEDQTITFTANAGNALESVTVDGAAAALTAAGAYTFTNVTAPHSIAVVFSADADGDGVADVNETNDITVTVTNGTAAPAGSPITVAYGANQTITFTANAGNALESVTVDGAAAALTAAGAYTFTNVTAPHSIVVVFSADANGNGIADVNEPAVIDDNPVPLAPGPQDLQVNENGEVTIDQDETPLAAAPTVGECCILHLIIMLCALAVAIYYTHDRKKRQKEEFETRFQMV